MFSNANCNDEMHNEERRPVVGYEGLYSVTPAGDVYRETGHVVNRAGGTREVQGGLKTPTPNEKGYLRVGLWLGGKAKAHKVHRLVALAYLPNPDGLAEVDHLNFQRADNRVENLEWVSHAENVRRACASGRLRSEKRARGPVGSEHPRSKMDEVTVREARTRHHRDAASGRSLARAQGVSPSTMSRALCGKTWAHVGQPSLFDVLDAAGR